MTDLIEIITTAPGTFGPEGVVPVGTRRLIDPELFSDKWMRKTVEDYHEVFIDAPLEQLKARDGKGLYARFDRGETTDVAGLDLPFQAPARPDLVIRNAAGIEGLLGHAAPLVRRIVSA